MKKLSFLLVLLSMLFLFGCDSDTSNREESTKKHTAYVSDKEHIEFGKYASETILKLNYIDEDFGFTLFKRDNYDDANDFYQSILDSDEVKGSERVTDVSCTELNEIEASKDMKIYWFEYKNRYIGEMYDEMLSELFGKLETAIGYIQDIECVER